MKTTEKLGLNLPEGNDYVDIEKINENFQKLDNHSHSPEDIGASPNSHNHDGAYSKLDHSHTANDVGAAPESHGNHVPKTQTANNATFLRNDNTWQKVTPGNIGAAVTATYTATVSTSWTASWTASGDYFYQDITISGILAADTPIVDIVSGSDNAANKIYNENICKVFRITTSANEIRVWATEAISTAFPIQLKVVR